MGFDYQWKVIHWASNPLSGEHTKPGAEIYRKLSDINGIL